MHGSHALTPEQQAEMLARYGKTYVRVQTGEPLLNRKTRRALERQARRAHA